MSSLSSVSPCGGMPRPNPVQMQRQLFDKLDGDGSGSIDLGEIESALGSSASSTVSISAEAMLKALDGDGDGNVSSDEFAAAVQNMAPPAQPGAPLEGQQGMRGMPPPPPPSGATAADGEEDGEGTATAAASSGATLNDRDLRMLLALASQYSVVANYGGSTLQQAA
ncbi:MAG: EF-hand domain-containing protein [Burkholderiales bacterium]|nr:EF-hand domain-containing protein [Burkholderiales bacterium]